MISPSDWCDEDKLGCDHFCKHHHWNGWCSKGQGRGCTSRHLCQRRGNFDVGIAEAMAMCHALILTILMEAGFRNFLLEIDNIKLHTHLHKKKVTSSSFGRVVRDIVMLANSCESVSFAFVRREGNKVAHRLAKLSELFGDVRDGWRNILLSLILMYLQIFN